jgi:hypothetical protein
VPPRIERPVDEEIIDPDAIMQEVEQVPVAQDVEQNAAMQNFDIAFNQLSVGHLEQSPSEKEAVLSLNSDNLSQSTVETTATAIHNNIQNQLWEQEMDFEDEAQKAIVKFNPHELNQARQNAEIENDTSGVSSETMTESEVARFLAERDRSMTR